jgi:hypothetical protein
MAGQSDAGRTHCGRVSSCSRNCSQKYSQRSNRTAHQGSDSLHRYFRWSCNILSSRDKKTSGFNHQPSGPLDSGDRGGNSGHHRCVCYLIHGTIAMQQNFPILSVFILFAALQGGHILCRCDTTAMEILSLAFTVVCPILCYNQVFPAQ